MKKIVRPKSVSTPKKKEPDIEGFMLRIQEQLAALAAKMDSWIAQIPGRSPEKMATSAPVHPASTASRPFQHAVPPQPFQGSLRTQGPGANKHGRGRRERLLHKAVCADCQKDCEIPFKPTGERPVYCKACFSKRKAGGSAPRGNAPSISPAAVPASETEKVDRRVVVTKKGVGKVTISEIVRPATRPFPSRDPRRKPAQRAKK